MRPQKAATAKEPFKGAMWTFALALLLPIMALGQTDSATTAKNSLESDVDAVLSAIDKDMPSAVSGLSERERTRIVASLLSAMGCGVEIVEDFPAEVRQPSKPEQGCLPGVMVSSNRIFYLRLNRLDKASIAAFKEECQTAFRMERRPLGLVIDLRECGGANPADASAALSALDLKDSGGISIGFHLAVLTDGRSSGAAELFAALVEQGRLGLALGEPTAGRPFPCKTVKAGDFTLSMPMIPETFRHIRQAPFKPSIDMPAKPQVDFTKLRSELRSEDSDPCLSRAIDLLVSLDAIKRKWKKTGN